MNADGTHDRQTEHSSDEDEQFLGEMGEGDKVLDDLEGKPPVLHGVSATVKSVLCSLPFSASQLTKPEDILSLPLSQGR